MARLKQFLVFSVGISIILISFCALAGPVPDTGQAGDYTPIFGEDSDYTINPPSYTKLGADGIVLPDTAEEWIMVKDNVTGLIWEKKTSENVSDAYDWDGANQFVALLNNENFGGFSDWRLPGIKELSFIINSGAYDPLVDMTYFEPTQSSFYWSSTPSLLDFSSVWSVLFSNGCVFLQDKSSCCSVRAVRGEQSESNLVVNGNGTVSDISTGLMWQQATAGPMTWEEAISYCQSLNAGGPDDYNWRPPNRNELHSLVDYTRSGPAIDITAFPDTFNSEYWSSTSYPGALKEYAYSVDFKWGTVVGYIMKSEGTAYVRAVRTIPPTNQPPDCSQATASPGCLWPPDHRLVPVEICGVTDPDGDQVTITVTGITSDEATASEAGAGGAEYAPDAFGVGTDTALVRAERSGREKGRVYLINFTADDGKGGSCSGSVMVKVPHDQAEPLEDCPAIDSGQNHDATMIN